MKLSPLLLAGSLVANASLCFFVVTRLSGGIDSSSTAATVSVSASAGKSAVGASAAADEPDPGTWGDLSAGEISATAARLRAEGFPLSVQRAVLAALIAERFADRHKALADLISAQPWWHGNLNNSAGGAKITAMRQQLQHDEKAALDEILGPDSGVSDYARARQAHQYGGDLTAGKTTELDRINSDYSELMAEVRNAAQGILLPEDRTKLAYLQQEQHADIAKLLTPAEMLDYDLRSSPTASQMRTQLAAFSPTEEEFRAIFQVEQVFDARFGSPELMTNEQRTQRTAAMSELNQQIQTILPPDRYAAYQQMTDPNYLSAYAVASRLQLPPTAAGDIVAVQKDITTRANAIRNDRTISSDQRTSQLSALGTEAVARLSPTLGDAGLAAYKQSGGYWITGLQPPPAPPATAKKP